MPALDIPFFGTLVLSLILISASYTMAMAMAAYDPSAFDTISWDDPAAAVERGATVFRFSCQKCHGPVESMERVRQWIFEPGLPQGAPEPRSEAFAGIAPVRDAWLSGRCWWR